MALITRRAAIPVVSSLSVLQWGGMSAHGTCMEENIGFWGFIAEI